MPGSRARGGRALPSGSAAGRRPGGPESQFAARLTDRSMLLNGLRQFIAAFLATGMAFAVGHVISGHIG